MIDSHTRDRADLIQAGRAEANAVPAAYYRTLVRAGYAPMDGYEMYYEIHGTGTSRPLVTIPPVFMTANVFPGLVRNRQLIAVELQGHGRSTDADRPFVLEQEADDVAAQLRYLHIDQADFFGESMGGALALLMAVRHPSLVRRVATYGADFRAFDSGQFELPPDTQQFQFQREGYERVAPDPGHWPAFFTKLLRMKFQGFSPDALEAITAPVLIAIGDHDSGLFEQALNIFRQLPTAQLAVIPGASHYVLNSDPDSVLPVVARFLDEPESEIPFATEMTGYHPGVTR
jgi:pimeloyl-ACP methyl ester carboxylesterase